SVAAVRRRLLVRQPGTGLAAGPVAAGRLLCRSRPPGAAIVVPGSRAAKGAGGTERLFLGLSRQPERAAMVHTGMPNPTAQTSEPHESRLLQRIAQHDRRAFEELYNAY